MHHSIRVVDWLAGSRLHLVDILVTRAFSYIPLYVLGFSMPVFYAYVAIVALQAVAAHANIRIPFGPLKYLLVAVSQRYFFHVWCRGSPTTWTSTNRFGALSVDRLLWGNDYPHDEGTWPDSGLFLDTIAINRI